MKKTLWIFNEYAGSVYHGMTFRHYYLAKELIKKDYRVIIFTSSFSHFAKQPHRVVEQTFTSEMIDGIEYIWIKTPPYKGSRSFGRIRNWFLFALKLFFIPLLKLQKPDYILVSSLPLHPILAANFLSKKYKAKLLFEVRDIWPLSAIELGGYSEKNLFIKHLQWLEDYAYKKADKVLCVLEYAYKHMHKRGLNKEKFNYIPNGISMTELEDIELLDKRIIDQIPKNKFIVGYTGSIGTANSLDIFIKVAKLLQIEDSIVFVIVGDGAEKETLQVEAQQLNNVYFIDAIGKKQIQSMLKYFDVCYIGWNKQSLYRYGISANKLFDYMYASKPILHAYSGEGDIVKIAKAGISVEAQNPQAIARGIKQLKNMTQEQREKLGQNARRYVLKNHEYKVLTKKLVKVLNSFI